METNETTAISTIITEAHMSIGDSLARRVVDILNRRGIEILAYQVHKGSGKYSPSIETLQLRVNQSTTLTLTLNTVE